MLTRRQKAGIEPMVKVQQKFRKKKAKKVHNNWLAMILLMPLYAYLHHREAAYMLMRIEQRGKLDVTGEHESLSDDDDYGDDDDGDGPLILQEDSDDDDGALNDDESQVETKSKTNFKKFVKKNNIEY